MASLASFAPTALRERRRSSRLMSGIPVLMSGEAPRVTTLAERLFVVWLARVVCLIG
jgi:hypothetical protein